MTADRSRPRKIGVGCPPLLAVRCRLWTRVRNGLQILAKLRAISLDRMRTAAIVRDHRRTLTFLIGLMKSQGKRLTSRG
jgi:hypothetical protein